MEMRILLALLIVATTATNGEETRQPNIGSSCLLDIALVIDCSGSIRNANPPGVDNWQLILDFVGNLVSSINVGEEETHVGAVTFGSEAFLHFHLSEFYNTESLKNAVQGIPYCSGNTNTTGGLRLTRTDIFQTANGDRLDVRDVIILITDGNPTREVYNLYNEVADIKKLGIRIVGVGVTDKLNETIIRTIVTDSERDYIFASNFSVLTERLDDLITETCRVVTTEPAPVPSTSVAETTGCSSGEYECFGGKCIPGSSVCDGTNDCKDGADEKDCDATTQPPGCSSGEYECYGGKCIPRSSVCDGTNDCKDGADEKDCDATTQPPAPPMPTGDGQTQGPGGPEPTGSPPVPSGCSSGEYECFGGKCIPRSSVCDGTNDCKDGADEKDCDATTQPPGDAECDPNCHERSGCSVRGEGKCDRYCVAEYELDRDTYTCTMRCLEKPKGKWGKKIRWFRKKFLKKVECQRLHEELQMEGAITTDSVMPSTMRTL